MPLKKSDIAAHLNATIKDSDASAFPQALEDTVRAFGMERLIDATGYTRQKIERTTRPVSQAKFQGSSRYGARHEPHDQVCSGRKWLTGSNGRRSNF